MSHSRRVFWLSLILAVEAFLFLWKIGHFFNGDSLFFFSHLIQNPAAIWDLFKGPDHLWQYRPLTFVIFSYFLYPLFGTNPLGYNIFPLFVHAANTLIVFGILRTFGIAERAALLGTFFFGTHCVAFYVTYGVAFLPDFSFSFFYLLSVFLFMKFLRDGSRAALAISLVCFILALFCKEAAITLPVVAAVIAFLWGGRGFSRSGKDAGASFALAVRRTCLFLIIGAAYLSFHWIVKAGQIYGPGITHPHHFEFSLQTLQFKYKYLKWAFNLPDALVFKFEGLTNYLIALAILVFALPFVFSAIRRLCAMDRLAWCGVIWFSVALSPVFLLRNVTMHHYLYVPLVGMALLLGDWLDTTVGHLTERKIGWARLAIPAFVLVFTGAVYHHNLNAARTSWIAEASTIAETSLRDLQRQRPTLPDGTTIYIINKSSLEALQWFYDYGSLIRLFYPAKSLDVRFIGREEAMPDKSRMPPGAVFFQYDGSHLIEVRGEI